MSITAPIRGLRNVEGSLYVVAANRLYEINGSNVALDRGAIPGVGRVSVDYNQVAGAIRTSTDGNTLTLVPSGSFGTDNITNAIFVPN